MGRAQRPLMSRFVPFCPAPKMSRLKILMSTGQKWDITGQNGTRRDIFLVETFLKTKTSHRSIN